jgi:hypothetical protein
MSKYAPGGAGGLQKRPALKPASFISKIFLEIRPRLLLRGADFLLAGVILESKRGQPR